MLTVAVPTYRRYDLLRQMMDSAEAGSLVPDRYYIVDNGGSLDPAAYGMPTAKIEVWRPGRNIGVSAAWNHILTTQEEHVAVVCDDVRFHGDTLRLLVEAYDASPEISLFHPAVTPSMFSVFMQRRELLERIGGYDENFWPAYFEDNDYVYRMKLAGVSHLAVPGLGYDHVGSGTLKSFSPAEMEEHHGRFQGLQQYYVRKWGGMPGREKYQVPFNAAAE
jgi:GT2 family glycosyltransferase